MKLEYLFEHNTWLFEKSVGNCTFRIMATNITGKNLVSFKIDVGAGTFYLVEIYDFNMTTDNLLLFCLRVVLEFRTASPSAKSICKLTQEVCGRHDCKVFFFDEASSIMKSFACLGTEGPVTFKYYKSVQDLPHIPTPQIWWYGTDYIWYNP